MLLIFTCVAISYFCIQYGPYLLLQFPSSLFRYPRLAHKDWNLILFLQTPAQETYTDKFRLRLKYHFLLVDMELNAEI